SLSSRPDPQSRIRHFRRSGRVSGKALPSPDRPVGDLTLGRDSPHPPRASAPRSPKLRPVVGIWRRTVRSPRIGSFIRLDRGAEPTDHHTLFVATGLEI